MIAMRERGASYEIASAHYLLARAIVISCFTIVIVIAHCHYGESARHAAYVESTLRHAMPCHAMVITTLVIVWLLLMPRDV